jgi:hypothetical protein
MDEIKPCSPAQAPILERRGKISSRAKHYWHTCILKPEQ